MKYSGDIDWKEAAKGTREVYPAGTYKVRCTGWEECSASTGMPQIRWFVDIIGPEYAGKKLVDHTALSSSSLWRIAGLVQAFGVNLANIPRMAIGSPSFKSVLNSCIGKVAYWTITKDEQYHNNKVTEYLSTNETTQESIFPRTEDDSPFKEHDLNDKTPF